MRPLLAFAIGLLLACGPDLRLCETPLGCEHCLDCAVSDAGACLDSWNACTFDPSCAAILVCTDDCPSDGFGDCERDCRGTHLGGAVMYDDLVGCLDDACALEC